MLTRRCGQSRGLTCLRASLKSTGTRLLLLACCSLWGLPGTAQDAAPDSLSAAVALEQSLMQVIEQAEPSVCSVARIRQAPGNAGLEDRFLQPGLNPNVNETRDLIPNQFAAGVIIAPLDSPERYVLTAYHAVRGGPTAGVPGSGDGSRLEVRFTSRHACAATIHAADPRSDLAVLRLEPRENTPQVSSLKPIDWTTAPEIRKGQLTVILSNPYWIARDGSTSASWALVANLARRPIALAPTPEGTKTLDGLGRLIHLDTRLPIGSSGSPVITLQGKLIGLTTSLAAIEGYERSAGFALPIDAGTRWIVETLLAGHEVEYGFLGVSPRSSPNLPADLTSQASGAIAAQVHEQSPAYEAGLRPGDLILAVNGQPTYTDLDLMRQVTLHPPGSEVGLTVLRGARGETLTLSVKLGKWPASDDGAIIASQRKYPLWRGLGVDYSTGRERYLDFPIKIRSAVLITDVEAGSLAKEALLEPGNFISQVNRTPVRTPAEFYEAVKAADGEVTLKIIGADDTTRNVIIPP